MLRASLIAAVVVTSGAVAPSFADHFELLTGAGHLVVDQPSSHAYSIRYQPSPQFSNFVVDFVDGSSATTISAHDPNTLVNVKGGRFDTVNHDRASGTISGGDIGYLYVEGSNNRVLVTGGAFDVAEVSGAGHLEINGSPTVALPYYAEAHGRLTISGGHIANGVTIVEKAQGHFLGGHIDTSSAPIEVLDRGTAVFYGHDFLIDGVAAGFNDFVVNEGDRLSISGILADGSILDITLLGGEFGGGFLQFRPVSSVIPTPAAAGLGLALLTLSAGRRRPRG